MRSQWSVVSFRTSARSVEPWSVKPSPFGRGQGEGADPPPSAFCLLPSAFRPLPSAFRRLPSPRRRGISLLEVLISIGVMAVGMLSIAALIPVGGVQVNKANIEERKATLGQNAYRDFQIRGLGTIPTLPDPTTLTPSQITAIQNQGPWVAGNGSPFFTPSGHTWQPYAQLPFVIDPEMIAVGHAAVQDIGVASFPPTYSAYNVNSTSDPFIQANKALIQAYQANPPPGPIIARLGLDLTAPLDTTNTHVPSRPLSDVIFTATDDVLTNRADDSSHPGSSALIYADAPYNTMPLK
ncbi:MAG TPA: prepilin-type N-terminal cleavage/methylation domain-containing protein, partial [Pirellulales bacterium]|nr:prepilin-type N-terminal cleavage/methylation domain-containing protein [Pirellulales bacterium]